MNKKILLAAAATACLLTLGFGANAESTANIGKGPLMLAGGPPPWAPAHGYRNKEKYGAPGEGVRVETRDFGISIGTCNREAVGAVLGGVVGGVIGSKVGEQHGEKALGTAAGVIIGVLAGRDIARKIDGVDSRCAVETLIHAKDGQKVKWRNPDSGVEFLLTPVATFQKGERLCRRYVTETLDGGKLEKVRAEACKGTQGWEIVNQKRI